MTKAPITNAPPNLRQRQRANGQWRVWWEVRQAARDLGFDNVELDADRPTWSVRQAERLNLELERAIVSGRRGAPRKGGRTMAALMVEYKRSRKFQGLKPATQRDYQIAFQAIETKWGVHPVADFSKPIMATWADAVADASGQHYAVSLIRKMSLLFSYAELIGWRPENSNPCFRLGMKQPKGRGRVVTWAEFDALMNAADQLGLHSIALACGLSMLQGQRQTDCLEARPEDFFHAQVPDPADAGAPAQSVLIWSLERSKRSTQGAMPVHPELRGRVLRTIDALPCDAPRLLIDELTGQPYSQETFQSRFQKVRARAAIECPSLIGKASRGGGTAMTFRDLRRTFGNLARAGGASKSDTADVLGNSAANNFQLADIYMAPQFATASRAVLSVSRPRDLQRPTTAK